VNKGMEITRGKTKVLHEYPGQPDVLVVSQLDNVSARDGERDGAGFPAAQSVRVTDALLERW
jgi:hypothetical protein